MIATMIVGKMIASSEILKNERKMIDHFTVRELYSHHPPNSSKKFVGLEENYEIQNNVFTWNTTSGSDRVSGGGVPPPLMAFMFNSMKSPN